MKKIKRLFFLLCGILFPSVVLARGSGYKGVLINFNAIISSGAIVNDGDPKSNNLNIVIISLIVIIVGLVGLMMFSQKNK